MLEYSVDQYLRQRADEIDPVDEHSCYRFLGLNAVNYVIAIVNKTINTVDNTVVKTENSDWKKEDDRNGHPLELIPFFRRWPKTDNYAVRIIVLQLIFNTLIAVFFVLMGIIMGRIPSWKALGKAFVEGMIISNTIGFTWTLVTLALGPLLRRMNRLPFPALIASYTGMGFLVTLVAFFGVSHIPGFGGVANWYLESEFYLSTLALSFFIALILGVAYTSRFAALERDAALARESERLQVVERQAMQANLRALQAQIEPHFLFNTLANVVGLIHPQPDKAKLMLEQFIVYLRATLSATREEHSTLGSEFEMMKNFLAILQIRMGDRLQVRFDLPGDLSEVPVPPMLMQPLVENAIKHGLEPKIEGGEITLSVKRSGEKIAITIADTGLGFQDSTSNGIGLKNVRERVRQLYGDAGSLVIEDNMPCGTRITISIPDKKH